MVRFSIKSMFFSFFLLVGGMILMVAGSASAASIARYMEKLDRGLIAVQSGTGTFLSWRLFGTDPQDNTFGFNVYKGTTKLNTSVITNATCYQDNSSGSGTYTVKPVTGSTEGAASEDALVITGGYVNIPLTAPAGTIANDCSIGDLDGDGQYELVLKWEASNGRDNSQAGVTNDVWLEGLKINPPKEMWKIDLGPNIRGGAHYTQHLVYDCDGDGKAEVAVKTAPGTKDGTSSYLKTGPAAGATDNTTKYANSDGYILTGPEYYTIFEGATGKELVTVNYNPPRGTVSAWGDSYGNRVDRFLSTVAYVDGERPSFCPCRGMYTRTTIWAVDWRDGKLTTKWFYDTDVSGSGKDGKANSTYMGQGAHNIRAADVDGDGCDEFIEGACVIDHDGKGLNNTGLGHGDALHCSDMDPDRPGLEVFMPHEAPSKNGGIAASFRDAATGKIYWTDPGTGDNGRGCCGPMTAGVKGWQMWSGAGGLWDVNHKSVGSKPGSTNFTMWWGADLTRAEENGTSITPGLTTTGMTSCNGTKSTPCLTADIFGDWREELVLATSANNALHIYTTTTPTTNRLYTLMHDGGYRISVSSEQAAYNQPPEPGIYIGPSMTLPQAKPNIKYYDGSSVSADIMPAHVFAQTPVNFAIKVIGNRTTDLPVQFNGMLKMMTVYDCSGKLIHKAVIRNNAINLQRDFGMSNGVYMVRVNEKVVSERE